MWWQVGNKWSCLRKRGDEHDAVFVGVEYLFRSLCFGGYML